MENFVEDPMEDVTEAIAETGGAEEEEEIDTATGKGTSDRLKGVGASLAIKKKSEGQGGKFTRGSLRVRRPTSTMKA